MTDIEQIQLEVPQAEPRSLMRNTNFLILWSGQVVSRLGSSISELALPLLVLALTKSSAQAGFITAMAVLPYFLFSLLAGALLDRWDRKLVMIICDTVRFVALGSIPLAYALNSLSIPQLYVVAFIQGTCFVFFNIAEVASLPQVVGKPQLPQASAFNEGADSAAMLFGPGIAGTIIGFGSTTIIGAAIAFLVDSISYGVSTISLFLIKIPFQGERASNVQRSLRKEIAEGIQFVWSHERIRTMALLTMTLNVVIAPKYLAFIVLANDMKFDAQMIGLFLSISGFGGFLGVLVAPMLTKRFKYGHIILACILISAAMTGVLAFATGAALLVGSLAINTMMVPIYNVANTTYRLQLTPDDMQGRVNSVFRLLALSGYPSGLALGGLLMASLGAQPLLAIIAIGSGLIGICATLFTELRRG